MTNIIIGAILLAIIAGATAYVIKAKKSGRKCIGCSASGSGECCCHKNKK